MGWDTSQPYFIVRELVPAGQEVCLHAGPAEVIGVVPDLIVRHRTIERLRGHQVGIRWQPRNAVRAV